MNPAELGQLRKLQYLRLATNQLSGAESGGLAGLLDIRTISLNNNLLSQAAVGQIINDLYADRRRHTYSTGNKVLEIAGTNAAPSAAACALVNTLRTSFSWTITANGC